LKRFIDIIIASIVFLLFLPFGIIIILILKGTGEREVFYFQKRVGINGEDFYLYKFATMKKNSSKIGTKNITLQNDPRVLPFGKILRKTKLNEMPQIINVFRGELSVVGPRPLTRDHYNMIPSKYRIKINGIASIIFRDEETLISNYKGDPSIFYKEKIAPFKGELENWYSNHKSIFIDLKIIIATIIVIFLPSSNIYKTFFKNLPSNGTFIYN